MFICKNIFPRSTNYKIRFAKYKSFRNVSLYYLYMCIWFIIQFMALARQLDQVMVEHRHLEELHRDHSKTVVKRILQGGQYCMYRNSINRAQGTLFNNRLDQPTFIQMLLYKMISEH